MTKLPRHCVGLSVWIWADAGVWRWGGHRENLDMTLILMFGPKTSGPVALTNVYEHSP